MSQQVKPSAKESSAQDEDWDLFEREKTLLLRFFTKADNPLQDSSEAELIPKDKCQELHGTVTDLHDMLTHMREHTTKLAAKRHSRKEKKALKRELAELDHCFHRVDGQLTQRLDLLTNSVASWSLCYSRLGQLCDWLAGVGQRLAHVGDTDVDGVQALKLEIEGQNSALTDVEQDLQALTHHCPSPDHLPLMAHVRAVRKRYDSLMALSCERCETLDHWQTYHWLKDALSYWIAAVQEYRCSTEPSDCESLEEAQDMCDMHETLLREYEERTLIFENMQKEAATFQHQPNLVDAHFDEIRESWDILTSSLLDQSQWLKQQVAALTTASGGTEDSPYTVLEEEEISPADIPEEHQPEVSDDQTENNGSPSTTTSAENTETPKAEKESVRAIFKRMTSSHGSPNKTIDESGSEDQSTDLQKHNKKSGSDDESTDLQKNTDKSGSEEENTDLLRRLKEAESRVKPMQQCILESSHAISPEQMPGRTSALQESLTSFKEQQSVFLSLQDELDVFLEINKNEADVTSPLRRYGNVLQRLGKMGDMLEARVTVCGKWMTFHQCMTSSHVTLDALRQRLSASEDVDSEKQLTEIQSAVQNLVGTVRSRRDEAVALDKWTTSTQVLVRDPATLDTVHLPALLQGLEDECEAVEERARTQSLTQDRTSCLKEKESEQTCLVVRILYTWKDYTDQLQSDGNRDQAAGGDTVFPGFTLTAEEPRDPLATKLCEVKEISSDANFQPEANSAGLPGFPVSVGYAETMASTMPNTQASFDWSDTTQDWLAETETRQQSLVAIGDEISDLSRQLHAALGKGSLSDSPLLVSRIEQLIAKRKLEEMVVSELNDRQSVVMFCLKPEEEREDSSQRQASRRLLGFAENGKFRSSDRHLRLEEDDGDDDEEEDVARKRQGILKVEQFKDLAFSLYGRFTARLLAVSRDWEFLLDLPWGQPRTLTSDLSSAIVNTIQDVLHEDMGMHTITWKHSPTIYSPLDILKMGKRRQQPGNKLKKREANEGNGEGKTTKLKDKGSSQNTAAGKHAYWGKGFKGGLMRDLKADLEDPDSRDRDYNISVDAARDRDELHQHLQTVPSDDTHRRFQQQQQQFEEERRQRHQEQEEFLKLVGTLAARSMDLEKQLQEEKKKSRELRVGLEREKQKANRQSRPLQLRNVLTENEVLTEELRALKAKLAERDVESLEV